MKMLQMDLPVVNESDVRVGYKAWNNTCIRNTTIFIKLSQKIKNCIWWDGKIRTVFAQTDRSHWFKDLFIKFGQPDLLSCIT